MKTLGKDLIPRFFKQSECCKAQVRSWANMLGSTEFGMFCNRSVIRFTGGPPSGAVGKRLLNAGVSFHSSPLRAAPNPASLVWKMSFRQYQTRHEKKPNTD
mmetsp:Transcript_101648/g.160738  ORF Transcript_101648/g.160738 Transcript_101648/m.160738 type:complete len:101 (+) Transcript_101648:2944-3246(+)